MKNTLYSFETSLHFPNKLAPNVSTVKQKHRMQGILKYFYSYIWEIDYREIKVIMLVTESYVKYNITSFMKCHYQFTGLPLSGDSRTSTRLIVRSVDIIMSMQINVYHIGNHCYLELLALPTKSSSWRSSEDQAPCQTCARF